ncbi:hypothetical protein ETSB_1000 [cyanobacterium endosymbiont of Epithemia turgida isolate EtSB Lake Yunoko]|nr:hypothetical protein ETSB_1000 [cyanobacterium endosymbiont of Epithemia turgida isolate EtSB Lake Yunoko]
MWVLPLLGLDVKNNQVAIFNSNFDSKNISIIKLNTKYAAVSKAALN